MSYKPVDVYLYFFQSEDGRSTDEKITAAAERYAEIAGIPALGKDEIHRTERGKPYFSRHSDVGLSVSHSGGFFVCALTHGAVGVDLEQHKLQIDETLPEAKERLCRLAERFFHAEEAAYIKKEPWSRFYEVWTAKECYVKLTGEGIDDHFREFSVLPHGDLSCLDACWSCDNLTFQKSAFAENYTLCVCKEEPFRVIYVGEFSESPGLSYIQ